MGEFLSKGSFLFLLWLLLSCEPWPELPECVGLDQAELPERSGVGVCFLSKKPEFWVIADFLEELAQLLSAVTRAPFCEWSVPLLARFPMLVGLHISIWVLDDTRAFWLLAPLHELLLQERQPLAFSCRMPVSVAFPCGVSPQRQVTAHSYRLICQSACSISP